jgi:hypothetical protein
MRTFTIDPDNNITALVDVPAGAANDQSFSTEKELAKLTADWPMSRLIDTWNGFAGAASFNDLKPVKKFTDRKSAVARIWKAIERLSPDGAAEVTEPAADVAPAAGKAKKSPTKGKRRDVVRDGAKGGGNNAPSAREGSKKAEVLDLMKRKNGATLAEIMKLTDWQAHTVRGFVSGTLIKKLGLKVESFRNDQKERCYRILE